MSGTIVASMGADEVQKTSSHAQSHDILSRPRSEKRYPADVIASTRVMRFKRLLSLSCQVVLRVGQCRRVISGYFNCKYGS